jgi:hypothetical protein
MKPMGQLESGYRGGAKRRRAACANCGAAGTGDFCRSAASAASKTDDLSVRTSRHMSPTNSSTRWPVPHHHQAAADEAGPADGGLHRGAARAPRAAAALFLFVSALVFPVRERGPWRAKLLFKLTRTPGEGGPRLPVHDIQDGLHRDRSRSGRRPLAGVPRGASLHRGTPGTALHLAAVSMPGHAALRNHRPLDEPGSQAFGPGGIVLSYANLAFADHGAHRSSGPRMPPTS